MPYSVTHSGSNVRSRGIEYTKQDMTIFVDDINGDDEFGLGTQYGAGPVFGKPYKTWTRAYEDIKDVVIAHNVRIVGETPATQYSGFPGLITPRITGNGSLSFAGLGVPIDVGEATFTVDTITSPMNDAGSSWVISPVGGFGAIVTDLYYGKFVLVTSGSAAGAFFPIFSSSITAVVIGYKTEYTSLGPGDTFMIGSPGVVIDTCPAKIEVAPQIDGAGINLVPDLAPLGFYNLDFIMTGADAETEIFRISNSCDVRMALVSIQYVDSLM
jgi:hypothetical protein